MQHKYLLYVNYLSEIYLLASDHSKTDATEEDKLNIFGRHLRL